MSYSKRLPRKLKKQLKKSPEEWAEYKEKRRIAKERHESLDIIFTRNYKHSRKIIRRMFRTGR
jgi:hypothetical protein